MTRIRQTLGRHVGALMAGLIALVALVLAAVTMLALQAGQVERERDEVGNAAVGQANSIEAVCAAGGEVARALREAGQCELAGQVKEQVSEAGVPLTITVPVQAVVDPDELVNHVRDQVAVYCASRNDCTPPGSAVLGVVVDVVADYLTANPPEPGRAPTEQEIRSAVGSVLTAAPEVFRGPPGENATDDQVAAQVAAYCSARGDCRGADGAQGAQGVSVEALTFARDDQGRCTVRVTLRDPADGSTRTAVGPAGDAACEPLPEPTTTPPLIETP